MKILIFLISLLFAFEVEFTKVYKKYITPNQDAIEIQTKEPLTFPFEFVKTKDGYILIGDINDINLWLENNFYAPKDAEFKNIKIAKVNYDEIQNEVIKKIKSSYKNCNIKKVIFLTPDEEKIITKPTTIKEEYKILLDCK